MLFFIILLFLIGLSLGNKDSKPILALLLLLLFVLSVGTQGGFDITGYEEHYNLPFANSEDRSYASDSLMMLAKAVGLSFKQFRIFIFFVWCIPIVSFLKKYCKYPTFVIALCFLFPILSFSSQLRNAIAMSFLYWGLYIYFKKEKKFLLGVLSFVVLLVIASFFHTISFVYFVCLIAFFDKIRTKLLLRICSIITAVFFFFMSTGILYDIVALLFGDYYANFYFFSDAEPLSLGNYNVFVGIIVNIWFTYRAEEIERKFAHEDNGKKWSISHFVLRLNIILLVFCPLMFISLTFYRIYQNVFILSVISIANASSHNNAIGRNLCKLYVLFYFVVTFFYIYGQGEFLVGWDNISL